MKLEGKEQHKAERREKTNDQCCKGHWFIFRNLFLEIYSYTTVMVMCPKQQQTQIEVKLKLKSWLWEEEIYRAQNSTKCETQNIFAKKQQNEHTPEQSKNIGKYLYTCTEFQACISYWDFCEILWL